jgi:hypothetical protein
MRIGFSVFASNIFGTTQVAQFTVSHRRPCSRAWHGGRTTAFAAWYY